MKLLILYYSGVGNTKMVAEKIAKRWEHTQDVSIVSLEKIPDNFEMGIYDAVVIGFPTIHASPAKPVMDFVEKLQKLTKEVPAFLFTTCGLYSGNTLRIFAKRSVKKNVIPIVSRSYRCAATDGALLAPYMDVWFRHERKLEEKIVKDSHDFIERLSSSYERVIPRFKLYSILNYPNKGMGQRFSPSIYVHNGRCISCGKCIACCPVKSIDENMEGYPVLSRANCIHCYRCIHHCPKKALSLSGRKPPSKTLYF